MLRRWCGACCVVALFVAPQARAVPQQQPPPPRAVLVGERGTVWSEGGVLSSDAGVEMARGLVGPTPVGRNGWVGAEGATGVLAGRYGSVLQPVDGGPRIAGCSGWKPDPRRGAREAIANVNARGTVTRTAAFAVSGGRLFLAGTASCPSAPPRGLRPVFVKTLPDGAWRIALNINAPGELVLAAAGEWLAVGFPAGSGMTAAVYDRHGERLRYRVTGLRPGQLQLDSAGRLLNVAASYRPSFPVLDPGLNTYARFQASWATPGSPVAHVIPTVIPTIFSVVPVLDAGRVALVAENGDGSGRLVVKDLRTGRTRPVIGTRQPFREVGALGLRGDALAWLQSDAPVPPDGTCFGYGQPGLAIHAGADLADGRPFSPAPAPPAPPPGGCGPPPP